MAIEWRRKKEGDTPKTDEELLAESQRRGQEIMKRFTDRTQSISDQHFADMNAMLEKTDKEIDDLKKKNGKV